MSRASRPSLSKATDRRAPRRGRALMPAGVVQDVVVRAMRLGDALASHMDKFFSQYGVTTLQFNVLRICYVRDPDGAGLPSGSFTTRLVRRVPDVPRLLDRLVKAGLLERVRSEEDRRVVLVRLTPDGVDLVERINDPLVERDTRLLADVPASKLPRLAADLERLLASVLANGREAEQET